MSKKPQTTGEHIVSLYGHITGLKKDIATIKNNHLKHIHQDISKLDKRFDKVIHWLVYGLGSAIILLITQLLYNISK